MARVTELLVNGSRRRIDVDPDRTLLSVLRDDLDLTGTKFGCGERRPGVRRRDCFAVMGGGIVVLLEDDLLAQETGGPRRGAAGAVPAEIGAWLHIGESGDVTVYTGKVEVGQNARTSLTQAVV